jgi:hypothetical protein
VVPVALALASVAAVPLAGRAAADSPKVSVFATGLNNPRGLVFGPGGKLYVAEGGLGGSQTTTPQQCTQVVGPAGPYAGGFTARISEISKNGTRSTVVDGLPSTQFQPALGSLVQGVSAVAFLDGHLYALIPAGGCSHGLIGTSSEIIRVNHDGSYTKITDLSHYLQVHSVRNPDPSDFEPDGTWFSMVAYQHALWILNPNGQEFDRVDPNTGHVKRLIDFSEKFLPQNEDWRGPASLAVRKGVFYTGTLNEFPIVVGRSEILKVTPENDNTKAVYSEWQKNLTTVLGLTFDDDGNLYAVENSVADGLPSPGNGVVIEIKKNGERKTIATGLDLPTGIAFRDDALYVSNKSYGYGPGQGEILKIALDDDDD